MAATLFVLVFFCAAAAAQNLPFLSHQAWSTEEGLPQASVHQVFQSSNGYLWLATEGGVSRFDGIGFRNYTHEEYPALTSDDISSIGEAPAGILWFGTSDGIVRFDGRTMRHFDVHDGLPSATITSIATAPDGQLLVLTSDGVARFDASSHFIALPSSTTALSSLERDAKGAIWLLGASQSQRYEDGVFRPVAVEKSSAAPILGIQSAPDGDTWTQTEHTVTFTSGATHRSFPLGGAPADVRIQFLFVDRAGAAWIGTNHGLFTVASAAGSQPQPVSLFQSESILSIFQDAEGNYWIGTENSGLHALRPRKFRVERATAGDGVTTVVEATDGTVWFGTRGDGLRALKDGVETTPVPASALTSSVILSLAPGTHGDIWAGTPDGLNHVDHGHIEQFTSANGLPDDFVRSILVSPGGAVWVGTRSGVAHLSQGKLTVLTTAQGLSSNSIGPILAAPAASSNHDALWIGTAAGLTLLSGESLHPFNHLVPGSDTIVTALANGPNGDLWIGTHASGLLVFSAGRFARIVTPSLPLEVDDLVVDPDGYLWIRGVRGVYRAPLDSLRRCLNTAQPCTPQIDHYGVADGMPSDELAGEGRPALWLTKANELLLATRKGIAVAQPLQLPINRVPPPVVLQRFTVDDVEEPLAANNLRIASGHRSFNFDYAALSYTMPSKVRYRYRLEGFDQNWIDAGGRRTAYYTSLPGRSYRFHVIAENNDGVWNDVGADIRFSVSPAFYLRWWFYALLLLLVAAAVLIAIQVRLRTVQTHFDLVLQERNRVAREIHDTLAQDLVSMSLLIELIAQSIRNNKQAETTERLNDARGLVKRSLEEARQSIWNLRENAAQNTLPARASRAVQEFAKTHPAARIKIGGAYRKLDEQTENQIMRILQESLSNIRRHAAASEVSVDLQYAPDRLLLSVNDNGRGFTYADARSMQGHYGVRGMEERAAALGANLTIASSPGEGTTITLILRLSTQGGAKS